eukprot:CAMPEP_0194565882 /NCGR_PEP_ID=MMETSP0292-20121207/4986_1 /TAXON_ID=39354 /ORGANISM="Heterosigma akashiwo, Strain CCMP2393" /LENGTH=90 /DNA_ID=CAMNT_0039415353 /DNA_START=32 /DNA_END=301 /DNA_ORIENTATION=+
MITTTHCILCINPTQWNEKLELQRHHIYVDFVSSGFFNILFDSNTATFESIRTLLSPAALPSPKSLRFLHPRATSISNFPVAATKAARTR